LKHTLATCVFSKYYKGLVELSRTIGVEAQKWRQHGDTDSILDGEAGDDVGEQCVCQVADAVLIGLGFTDDGAMAWGAKKV
jgi:hypothetical protein